MFRKVTFTAICLVLTAIALNVGYEAIRRGPGRRTISLLKNATKVEVFRIDGDLVKRDMPAKAGQRRVGSFIVTCQGQNQGRDFAFRLGTILADQRTYSNGRAMCFDPGVAYRVWNGTESVDFLICFKCDNFRWGRSSDDEMPLPSESFVDSPMRAKLVQLTKQAFPDDEEIQGLKE